MRLLTEKETEECNKKADEALRQYLRRKSQKRCKSAIAFILEAQDAKTLKEVGEWLDVSELPYHAEGQDEITLIFLKSEIESLKRGEMPGA